MEDVKKETQEKETQPKAEEKVEVPEEPKTLVDKAREEREKLEKATEQLKLENDRSEKIRAAEALGGRADAGQGSPAKVSDEEFSNNLMEGKASMDEFLAPADGK